MSTKDSKRDSPVPALLIVVGTAAVMYLVGSRIIDLHVAVGPWFIHHWVSWAGVAFVAVFTPVFYIRKRQRGERYSTLLAVHVFGGLFSAALISVHFIQHVTRPAEFFPDLGTGLVLYIAMVLSVLTGFLMRYRWITGGMREWRAVHTGAAVTLYLTVVVHALKGLGVL